MENHSIIEDWPISPTSPLPPSLQQVAYIKRKRPGGTAQYQAAPPDDVDCKVHETLTFQE